jgi:hypothetical protein
LKTNIVTDLIVVSDVVASVKKRVQDGSILLSFTCQESEMFSVSQKLHVQSTAPTGAQQIDGTAVKELLC